MKKLLAVVGILVGAFLALAIVTATPLVGEVVTLHTRDAAGEWQTTPLWIVDLPAGEHLRAGDPESAWVARMRANPEVRLERGGQLRDVRLVEDPSAREPVNRAMAEGYGWANDFVGIFGDRALSLAMRVEPAAAE